MLDAILCDMGKGRRVVEYKGTAPGKQQGRGPRLWAYGYADLAKLLGSTEDALRARVARGWDPGDLETVCREWAAARGITIALALLLAMAASACGDITTEDAGGGGVRAELGAGGTLGGGTGGAPVLGAGGAVSGTGGHIAGVGGHVDAAGTGGALAAGTGGMVAQPGTGGAVATIPECNGTGAPASETFCGYIAPNGFEWVHMFKNGFRCVTCFSSPGHQQLTECLDSSVKPAALCVKSCDDACAY